VPPPEAPIGRRTTRASDRPVHDTDPRPDTLPGPEEITTSPARRSRDEGPDVAEPLKRSGHHPEPATLAGAGSNLDDPAAREDELTGATIHRQREAVVEPRLPDAPRSRRRLLITLLAGAVALGTTAGLLLATGVLGGDDGVDKDPATATPLNRPRGLEAEELEGGASAHLSWLGREGVQYQILSFNEAEPGIPVLNDLITGTEATVAIEPLEEAGGYCFFVADLVDINEAVSSGSPDDDAGVFSDPACIRDASEETVTASDPQP